MLNRAKWLRIGVVLTMMLYAGLATIGGSANPTVDLSLFHLIATPNPAIPASDWTYVPTANIGIAFKSENTGNVRGEVAFMLAYPGNLEDVGNLVQRAYLQVRFPSFRLTMGKTQLDWGEGVLFNAGDVLFSGTGAEVSLSAMGSRTTTTWLTAVNYPLGPFSFLEAVVIPSKTIGLAETSLGGRFYTSLGDMKLEIGYSFRWELSDPDDLESGRHLHHPYVSMQGNFGPDWHLSSTLALPTSGATAETIRESWTTSLGLFQLIPIGYRGTLALRLEAQLAPFRHWSKQIGPNPIYALMLYPEISYSLDGGMQFIARSIISPVDASAVLMGGVQWKVLQGLTLQAYLTSNLGDEDDVFAKAGSQALLFGAHWVF